MKNHTNTATRGKFLQRFIDHPASVGESYFQHALFAGRMAGLLFGAGAAALIHALVPPLFETTASAMVQKIHNSMQNRH